MISQKDSLCPILKNMEAAITEFIKFRRCYNVGAKSIAGVHNCMGPNSSCSGAQSLKQVSFLAEVSSNLSWWMFHGLSNFCRHGQMFVNAWRISLYLSNPDIQGASRLLHQRPQLYLSSILFDVFGTTELLPPRALVVVLHCVLRRVCGVLS